MRAWLVVGVVAVAACGGAAAPAPMVPRAELEKYMDREHVDAAALAQRCPEGGWSLNDPASCVLLSLSYDEAVRVPKDPARSFEFAKRACAGARDAGVLAFCLEYSHEHHIEPPLGYVREAAHDDAVEQTRAQAYHDGRQSKRTVLEWLGLE